MKKRKGLRIKKKRMRVLKLPVFVLSQDSELFIWYLNSLWRGFAGTISLEFGNNHFSRIKMQLHAVILLGPAPTFTPKHTKNRGIKAVNCPWGQR